jgi:hypothetical protein
LSTGGTVNHLIFEVQEQNNNHGKCEMLISALVGKISSCFA